ncbi:MAG: YdeI/OmpD-associated family protein [Flavobacteriales bacterium]|nr:YdeI/OmpD-associated family protein [Flavobacteriales bacterium]
MNPKVDQFLDRTRKWKEEMTLLRAMCLNSGLEEDYKWMHPCYTLEGKNVVLIHGFKEYCALLFHKGALLKDDHQLLIQQTENVQAARQLRFTGVGEIQEQEEIIRTYILEAIQLEREGKEVPLKKTSEFPFPDELKEVFATDQSLEQAFHNLTPGRQRAWLLFISQAKQAKTRYSRIESAAPKIHAGKGPKE